MKAQKSLNPSSHSAIPERLWALIFVTAIVTASVIFESMKEIVQNNTPPTMRGQLGLFTPLRALKGGD